MGTIIDMTGKKYGRLTVLERAGTDGSGNATWLCQCECGNTTIVPGRTLRNGESKSCGCLHNEVRKVAGKKNKKHGMKHTRIYSHWCAMKSRCYNPHNNRYATYGARGITVCDEWRDSFEAFRDWAQESGYRDDLTIDRIDPNGPYSPENCRWATQKEQQNNRRNTKRLTFNGKTKTISEWAEETGLSRKIISGRLYRGWTVEKTLGTPKQEAHHG